MASASQNSAKPSPPQREQAAMPSRRQHARPGRQHLCQIASGETLTSIVRQQAANQGISLSPEQSHRMALDLANRNGISDPNRIHSGQNLQLQRPATPS